LLKKILSVGAWTLVSRATGFARDVVMAAILGTGPMADAFVVAFKLPNHFRAIFGEGAFNAAFVPAFTRVHEQAGAEAARRFEGYIVSLLLVAQIVLLALAFLFMPQVVRLLAPGFEGPDGRFELAVELTRITFPYLLLITLATLYGAVLNAVGRFTAAAAAPILLNVCLVAALLMARWFPSAAHAAAWGVTLSGVLQLAVLVIAARRANILAGPGPIRLDPDVKRFFVALGPATIGSMGTQIAMFADTIIATLLPTGAVSALYYADRIYQLPLGVIGIAAGTVLLPEMSRLIASGRPDLATAAQNRTMLLAWLMAAPFLAGFLAVPDLIMHALFARGAFTAARPTPPAQPSSPMAPVCRPSSSSARRWQVFMPRATRRHRSGPR
jgi:putative peptidoglycan lipid II flippase